MGGRRRKVTYEEGAKFAKDNGLTFLEVSAKTAYQVEDAFKKNAELLLDKIEKGAINMESEVVLRPRSPPASRRATSPTPRSNSTSAASRPNPKRRNAVDPTTCSLRTPIQQSMHRWGAVWNLLEEMGRVCGGGGRGRG